MTHQQMTNQSYCTSGAIGLFAVPFGYPSVLLIPFPALPAPDPGCGSAATGTRPPSASHADC